MEKTREVMTSKLVTVSSEKTMQEAWNLMKSRNIRHLPVTDGYGTIIGILSDRDVQRAMRVEDVLAMEPKVSFDADHKVQHYMSWPVKTVSDVDALHDVVQRMLRERVSAFVVHSERGTPRGIVTTDDLLKYLLKLLEREPSGARKLVGRFFDEFAGDYGV